MNLENLNQSLFLALNAAPGLTGWPLALAVAAARGAVGVLGILLLWRWVYARPAERRALVAVAAAVVPALALNWLLGLAWPHPRPFMIGLGQLYLDHRPEPSFPSDHATLMWTLAVGLLWRWPARVTSWLAIALAALTSWARVFLGLHFPLDIAGSIAVAVATVAVLSSLRNVVEHHVAAPIERLYGVVAARWGRRTADRQPASDSAAMVPGKVRGRWRGWVWAAPATLVLVLLGLGVAWHGGIAGTAHWPEQQAAFLALNAVFGKVPAPLWSAVTLLGDSSVLMLLLALFLLGRPQVFAAVLASVPAGALFSGLLKHWADVPRPAAVLDHASFHLIGPALHHNSFPSGHTVSAFAAAAAVLATLAPSPRRGREWVLLVAGLMVAVVVALSRVAVGAHWLLDLVAGASGGWLAGLSGAALARHAGWWRWLFFGAGRRAASVGLIVWGLLVWFRPHDMLTGAAVLGLAGLCGIAAGLGLLLTGRSVSALPVPLATGSSAPDASVDETVDQVAQQPDRRTS